MANEVFLWLKSRGWHLKDVSVVEELMQHTTDEPSVEALLMDMDLRTVGDKCLPDAATIRRLSHLQGPKVLQIVSLRNILESSESSVVTNQQQHARLLRICLTDGHTNVTAIEYRPLPVIPSQMAPGTKVCFEKNVSIQNGILLLEGQSLRGLGGRVQSLYEEWEMECKYSGMFRSMLNSSQVQGPSAPPPFERIKTCAVQNFRNPPFTSMGRQTTKQLASYQRNRITTEDVPKQDAAVLSSDRKLSNPRTGQIEDNSGSPTGAKVTMERIRVGYEMYRPKVSEHLSAENLICSEVGNCEQADSAGADFRTNNNQSDPSKSAMLGRQPDVVNKKTVSVNEAVPVQNKAAAQKLLNKLNESGKESGAHKHNWSGRTRARYKGKDKREELAVLTLEEWEMQNGKTDSISRACHDVSQDEELARELQTQLDLEAANVRMTHDEAAEKIRMSMFNFRNMNDANVNGSRKPRGRGRGKRRVS